jgi:DegV family protein with EDD domain
MAAACIVTDNSVQFTRHSFIGRDLVFLAPFRISFQQKELDASSSSLPQLPKRLTPADELTLTPPKRDDFLAMFDELCTKYGSILAISMSSEFSPVHGSMQAAARGYKGKADIHVVDSTTVGAGLGAVVQHAAEMLHRGANLSHVEEQLRAYTHHLYAQAACPNLSYLANLGQIAESQAVLGEYLEVTPVFALEEGRLLPATKVKNNALLLENFQEFIDEFDRIDQVVISSGAGNSIDTHILKEHIQADYLGAYFADLPLNLVNACLFGPDAIWISAVDR